MTLNRTRALFRALLLPCLLAACCQLATAQGAKQGAYEITYRLSALEPASHLFEVSVDVWTPAPVEAVEFQMPRWSPGRYAVYDFAKNVQEVRGATGCPPRTKCERRALPVTRADAHTWRVETDGGRGALLSYKVFADDLSGTFSQFDARHANVNGGSVFMYVVGRKQDPVTLYLEAPAGWRVIHARADAHGAEHVLRFENYDLLIDTPVEMGADWTADEFDVGGKTYRVVVHSSGDEAGRRPALVRDLERIVRAAVAVWGAPEFDRYTFIFHFAPAVRRGDGMEHLDSTQIILTRALGDRGALEEALDIAAHEFFHAWNVKRLRPAELGPWDFTRPVATRSLWIAEGITNYYGHLLQRRANVWDDRQLYRALAAEIGFVENAPGSRLMSAEEASLVAPFIDRAAHYQRTNLAETAVSYYDKGDVLGLTLDLLIRGRTRGARSLDDVMRRMYEEFYVKSPPATYYLRGRGYAGADFERAVSEVSGSNFDDFFARHVRGTDPPPYDEALAHVGLRLTRTPRIEGGQMRDEYRIEEIENATAEARRLRDAWLSGSAPARP